MSEHLEDINTSDEIQEIANATEENPKSAEVLQLEAQLKEKENKYVYLYADFENFKKRNIKERSDLLKFGWESVAKELLQVVDNLERALSFIPEKTDANLVKGLQMVVEQFHSTLKKQGVERVASLHKMFDPHFHETVGFEDSNLPSGTVVREEVPGIYAPRQASQTCKCGH